MTQSQPASPELTIISKREYHKIKDAVDKKMLSCVTRGAWFASDSRGERLLKKNEDPGHPPLTLLLQSFYKKPEGGLALKYSAHPDLLHAYNKPRSKNTFFD